MSRVLPQATPTSEPYWQGCREGVLRLQQCPACSHLQFYPRICCSQCQHQQLNWVDASGRGNIASFTVVRHSMSDAYPAPFVVALIDLAEGPRMMSHIVDVIAAENLSEVQVGSVVQVAFEQWTDQHSLPVFRLVADEEQ